jgi:bloom syndrome protein
MTGSVCFQVPAVTIEHGITIVIVPIIGKSCSPLQSAQAYRIALMHDQVSSLQEKGIQAASLCSTTPPGDIAEVS